MIYEVKMYAAACDNCKEDAFVDTDYSCWPDELTVNEQLGNMEWHRDGDKHYCEKCWSHNDNDDIVIDSTRTKTDE